MDWQRTRIADPLAPAPRALTQYCSSRAEQEIRATNTTWPRGHPHPTEPATASIDKKGGPRGGSSAFERLSSLAWSSCDLLALVLGC